MPSRILSLPQYTAKYGAGEIYKKNDLLTPKTFGLNRFLNVTELHVCQNSKQQFHISGLNEFFLKKTLLCGTQGLIEAII